MRNGRPSTKTTLVRLLLSSRDVIYSNLLHVAYTQTLALTLFGIIAGVCAAYFRRARWMLIFGLVVRLVSVGAMIQTKGAQCVATVP